MGDDISSGLSSMSVCFEFCSTIVEQLGNRNPYFYQFRCHHPVVTQLRLESVKDFNCWFGTFLCQDVLEKLEIIPNKTLYYLTENGTEQHRKTFKWNGDPKKNLFIACSTDCLSVGPDDGKFAIYLDSALNQGRSQSCLTFNNDPLTPKEDFVASQVEMWTFR